MLGFSVRVTKKEDPGRQQPCWGFLFCTNLTQPTSALDQETENTICNTFDEVAGNHTVIAVAHRLNTIKNYDRIYVLEHGRIVEQGTHKELLNQQ